METIFSLPTPLESPNSTGSTTTISSPARESEAMWKTPLLRLKPLATISSPTANPSVRKEPAARLKELPRRSTKRVVAPVVTVVTVIVTLSSPRHRR
jgi:hypothetical protein